jgi:single-stranded-DNA-specific exonuclease
VFCGRKLDAKASCKHPLCDYVKTRAIPVISDELKNLHPVLARVYAARGVDAPEQVQHKLKHLATAQQLHGLTAALALLTTALQQQQRIVIVGDFDADGATSTALSVLAYAQWGQNMWII